MVPPAGEAVRPAQLRYVNQPRPILVKLDRRGAPRAVVLERQLRPVRRVRDRWRVDDTWWRDPICRMYYELELMDGRIVTLYHDRIADRWYRQWYGAPVPATSAASSPCSNLEPRRNGHHR